MSIEDVDYLKSNSFKQSYTFLVDSKDRDYIQHPHPNNYTVHFTVPFKNVFGLEIIDASVPRTMYNVDYHNNILYYAIVEHFENDNTPIDKNQLETNINKITVSPGDYSITSLMKEINTKIEQYITQQIQDGHNHDYFFKIESVSTPVDIKNKIRFVSDQSFVLDMNRSTIRDILGFNLTQNVYTVNSHKFIPGISNDPTMFRYFYSINNQVESPGIVDTIGEKYVTLHCSEIEDHSTRSLSYSKYNLGLARFRLGVIGYNDESISINRTKLREFHPIGKFSRMTLEFRMQNGMLYDFKGANHNITFSIHYYEINNPKQLDRSILNPNYNADMMQYMTRLLEDDEDDDENEDEDEDEDEDDEQNV